MNWRQLEGQRRREDWSQRVKCKQGTLQRTQQARQGCEGWEEYYCETQQAKQARHIGGRSEDHYNKNQQDKQEEEHSELQEE